MEHLAFVNRKDAHLILYGRKTCESRLSRVLPPAWKAQAGDRIFIKVSGGDGLCVATVAAVDRYDGLRPDDIEALRDLYWTLVDGPVRDDGYWRLKRESRYAVFCHLRDVRPWPCPKYLLPTSMSAWIAGFVSPLDADATALVPEMRQLPLPIAR